MEYIKKCGRQGIALGIILALCVGILGESRAEAVARPAKPSIRLTKRTKTKATIKIKQKGRVTGYQISVATSRKGKFKLVTGTKSKTVVLRKLKKSKVYYVKIRAFRTKGLRIKFGKYSKVLKIPKYQKAKKKKVIPSPSPTDTDLAMPTQSPEPTDDPGEMPTEEPTPGIQQTPDSSDAA